MENNGRITLRAMARELESAGVENPRGDVLRLAEYLTGMSSASLMARYDYDISACGWLPDMKKLVDRRRSREPLQYIIGSWEFYGDEYAVTPDTLIPRPETELLVDYGARRLRRGCRVADLCCGSGCIGIALARHAGVVCDSVDISSPALAVAEKNSRTLGVSDAVAFHRADVTDGESVSRALSGSYSMIFSNPPYVRRGELSALLPELSFEPSIALDGGVDGLDFYRGILDACGRYLEPFGEFVFEIGYDEADGVSEIASDRGYAAAFERDGGGFYRLAALRRADET